MTRHKVLPAAHYAEYLVLDKVLDAQHPRSALVGKQAHDEMLFIIIHQVYELWMKQILHELGSVEQAFADGELDEREIAVVVHRLGRVEKILRLFVEQIDVLETMTPVDFLEFRNYLVPASGFQSFQFRKIETLLGLRPPHRIAYGGKDYKEPFSEAQREELAQMERQPSVFDHVAAWLERMPFLNIEDFHFLEHFRRAVAESVEKDREAIQQTAFLDAEEKALRLRMLEQKATYYEAVLNPQRHTQLHQEGRIRLSYRALLAALMIYLYRDEPVLQQPYDLLNRLMNIDETLVLWRFRHAQMVLRMLGYKMGTGGSSGYDYLMDTVHRHSIFKDLMTVHTFLVPRSALPPLPETLRKALDFHFAVK